MRILKNTPIKRKLTLVILLSAGVALLVAGGALFAFQLITFRHTFSRDLSALAEIIANHSTAALAFKDKKAALEMLDALKAKPHIVQAHIRLNDGAIFAQYGENLSPYKLKTGSDHEGLCDAGDYWIYAHPIVLDGEKLGTLYLCSNYAREYRSLLTRNAGIMGLVLSFSILLTLLLSASLQRVISVPILKLAEVTQHIALEKDYSVRAQKYEQDEIGLLTDAFNQMLQQIQLQDAALRASQQKFEGLVNSIEGIVWEADPFSLQFLFVSPPAERLLWYPLERWISEPRFWQEHIHPHDREMVLAAYRRAIENLKPFALEYRMLAGNGREVWIRNSTTVTVAGGQPALLRGVMLDITERKQAEAELEQLHKQLVEKSRAVGMAEVATGVLHNVGNVLNSVNVSANLVQDRLRSSKISNLAKAAALLEQHNQDLEVFLSRDPKGKVLPGYLIQLTASLQQERASVQDELALLTKNIQHIKDIVAMQQSYAKIAGMIEHLSVTEIFEDALQINASGFTRHGVEVIKDFAPVVPVAVDKHKVLQILINLLHNAKYALDEGKPARKELRLGVRQHEQFVRITVTDNGTGIPPENLTRIFSHGFTTRKDGHGFGLHSGALAAKEMGGSLSASSEGLGKGSTFTLDLPIAQPMGQQQVAA